jgi:adenylate cyclase
MASKPLSKSKFMATKNFAFVIAVIVFLLFLLLGPDFFLFSRLQLKVLDTHFDIRQQRSQQQIQQGVTFVERNLKINPDILILGIDNRTLDDFGSWPFPRYRHADLLNTLARIKDETRRESLIFLDLLFNEISSGDPVSDALLAQSVAENGRVITETFLSRDPNPANLNDEYVYRHDFLIENLGYIENVSGNWISTPLYLGMDPPLPAIVENAAGYGFATVLIDPDGVYRNVPLLLRSTKEVEELSVDDFERNFAALLRFDGSLMRLQWTDKENSNRLFSEQVFDSEGNLLIDAQKAGEIAAAVRRTAPPKPIDTDNDGEADSETYAISLYQDHFMPSVVLTMALQYLNIDLEDIEVVLGEYIRLPEPRLYNPETRALDPYRIQTALQKNDPDNPDLVVSEAEFRTVPEILIPIDESGRMHINYMGEGSSADASGPQTFPVRPYSAYARRATGPVYDTWPTTLALDNKIILAGFFAAGLDEKATTVGTMFGIELFANALNTILMENFLIDWPQLYQLLFTAGLLLIIALLTGRTNNFVALGLTLILIMSVFIFADIMFNSRNILIDSVHPAFAMILTFLSVVIYRGLTEEREKRRVQGMFGQYVSPEVVDEIVNADTPPELGGVDKELTVFFSDIRGFTTLSEKMSPQALVNHLNIYLTAMTDIIMEYKGTLDKYVGDEIMCFWGAPIPQKNHAILACQSALKQMQKLRELNEQWPRDLRIDIGIGINSGIMTVGNMGSSGRMNYTLMGDNVNLGARLEGINKQYFGQEWVENGEKHIGTGSKIILSEYTYGLVKDKVVARELDNIRVKGKNKPVVIYELIDVLVGLDPYLGE